MVLNVKAVVAAFNQEKALVGAFSVITNLRMELFEALVEIQNNRTTRCAAPVHQQGEGQGVPDLQLVAASLLGLENVAGLGAEEDGLRRGEGV